MRPQQKIRLIIYEVKNGGASSSSCPHRTLFVSSYPPHIMRLNKCRFIMSLLWNTGSRISFMQSRFCLFPLFVSHFLLIYLTLWILKLLIAIWKFVSSPINCRIHRKVLPHLREIKCVKCRQQSVFHLKIFHFIRRFTHCSLLFPIKFFFQNQFRWYFEMDQVLLTDENSFYYKLWSNMKDIHLVY